MSTIVSTHSLPPATFVDNLISVPEEGICQHQFDSLKMSDYGLHDGFLYLARCRSATSSEEHPAPLGR